MKKDLTELVFIIDKSGSMCGLEDDTVGGFNAMIRKQKALFGECLVSCFLFDNCSKLLYDRIPIDRIALMKAEDYVPGGSTALFDALGEAIHHIASIHKYARDEDVPEKTIFIITTDGEENSSQTYSSHRVRQMVEEETEKHGWEFLYLAANIDAAETGSSMGILRERAVNYNADQRGTAMAYEAMDRAVSSLRCGSPLDSDWGEDLEEDIRQRGRRNLH